MSIWISLILSLAATLALSAVFSTIADKWPETYSTVKTAAVAFARFWLFGHLLFRLSPIVIVGYLLGCMVRLWEGVPWLVIVTVTIAHLCLTNFRAIWELTKNSSSARGWFIIYHCIISLLVSTSVALSVWLGWAFPVLGIEPDELLIAFWTAIMISALAGGSRRILGQMTRLQSPYSWARDSLGEELFRFAGTEAIAANVDPHLIRAIVLGEVLQRPKWVRRLERFFGYWRSEGTYGVAQAVGSNSMTDKQSITLLVQQMKDLSLDYLDSDHRVNTVRFRACVERRTPDPEFSELVLDLYGTKESEVHRECTAQAPDWSGEICRQRARRLGQIWIIEGNYWARSPEEKIAVTVGEVDEHDEAVGRRRFTLRIPVSEDEVKMRLESGSELDVSLIHDSFFQ